MPAINTRTTTAQLVTNENHLPPNFTRPTRRPLQLPHRDCIIQLAKKDKSDSYYKRIHWHFSLLHFFHISLLSVIINHDFKIKTPWEVEFAAAAATAGTASSAKRKERSRSTRSRNAAKRRKFDDKGSELNRRSGQDFKLWEDR